MSTIHYPDDFDVDYHADLQWRRQEMARKALSVSDVLAEVDALIAAEEDERLHPLYSLAAHSLGETTQPGSAEGLMDRFRRLVDYAVERLVEQKLADPHAWED
jgi:hypothetical protein